MIKVVVWKPDTNVAKWRNLAEQWSRQTKVPAAFLLAIIQQESGGNAAATRYEPDYEQRYTTRCREIARVSSLSLKSVAASYGLMQLMLPLAWGYLSSIDKEKPVEALLDPDKNIRYGAAHLSALRTKCPLPGVGWDGAVVRWVAGRYNGAGSDSGYARNVAALYTRFSELLKKEV